MSEGSGRGLPSYENKLLAALSVSESAMFVDRLALGILTPFLVADLALSNFEIGLLASVFALTYAFSGVVGGWISDRSGQRKVSLLIHVTGFSILSAITGLTWSFASLCAVRVLLGLFEGPVLAILQSIMIPASSPGRKAFNVAFLMNVAPFLFGQFAAPIVLTHLAEVTNWRTTFLLTALPGLLVLPFLVRLVPGGTVVPRAAAGEGAGTVPAGSWRSLLGNRNLLLCVVMAACTGTWIYMFNTFLPLYLVKVAGYSKISMGYVASMLGVGGCVASLIFPAASDRYGRKPVLILGFALGLIAPAAVLFFSGQTALLVAGILVGSAVLGITPLTITLIPSDVVGESQLARAIGLTSASSAVVGGMVMTGLAGKLADLHGLAVTLGIAACAMVLAIALALLLRLPAGARAQA